jgi:DNA-binding GntR family transcriptional regulator
LHLAIFLQEESGRDMTDTLSDKAYLLIKSSIINCELPGGAQIVQSQLAERYEIGTTPIREALQRLVQEGYIQSIPRFGYIVTSITMSDIREIFELRSILETAAVELAILRATEEQLQRIAESANFKYIYHDQISYNEFLDRNTEFHRSIADTVGNQRLSESITRVLNESTRIFHLGLDLKDSALEMRDEHVTLSKALLARDSRLALNIIRSQIERSQQRIVEALMTNMQGNQPLNLRLQ